MTPLDKPLRRELTIGEKTYTITIAPEGLKITEKGHRKGIEMKWPDLVNGDAGHAQPPA